MDRSVIEAHILEALAHAMEHARQGRSHVERQRQSIKRLARGGHDTAMAVSLLHTLEEAQTLHDQTVRNVEDELVAFHSEQNLSEQSRREIHHRVKGLKEAQVLLGSSGERIEESRSLLGRQPKKH